METPQQVLQHRSYLTFRDLSGGRHLDAEEAVVLGAGLYAANLSTTFKLRKFRMSDGATYPVVFQVCASAPRMRLTARPRQNSLGHMGKQPSYDRPAFSALMSRSGQAALRRVYWSTAFVGARCTCQAAGVQHLFAALQMVSVS